MSETAIIVTDLHKKYDLGSINTGTFSDDIKKGWAKFRGKQDPTLTVGSDTQKKEYWALNGVDFEIKKGEALGIIGKNGAGKSTLLKILSRITTPTKGSIKINGRMASLLEVGTGFHPDLTGRENIFLNGAILGMTRLEIKSKIDEIIAFSGVEKHIDTPVKRYSSGMYVRLAFAVAAHLEPEILVLDEVLAVGDAEFQRKCLGKMNEVSKNGRTVLFVSHNMAAVQSFCTKVLFLRAGRNEFFGSTEDGISMYLRTNNHQSDNNLENILNRQGSGDIRFTSYKILTPDRTNQIEPQSGSSFVIRLHFKNNTGKKLKNLKIALGIDDEFGNRISNLSNETTNEIPGETDISASYADIYVKNFPLRKGSFSFTLFSTVNEEIADWIQDAGKLEVESGDFYKTGKVPDVSQGLFYMDYNFNIF